MKRTLFLLALVAVALPLIATAQPTTRKQYVDSLSGVATAAGHLANETPGYGQYKYLRTDVGAYKDKQLGVVFTRVTDSIRIQGGYVTFGQDTTWTSLNIKPNILKIGQYTVANTIPQALRDTTVQWLSPVTTDQMKFVIPLSEFYYPVYRITLAMYDSGKVYITDMRRGGY
jgi:hypothetical protein